MAYIGYQPSQLATAPFAVNTFTGDGSTTTFTLSQAVPGANEAMVEVVVENVQQNPVDAYTISGATNTSLVFSEAPISGAAIYVIHKGESTYNLQPSTGSVTSTSLDPVLRNFTIDTFTGNASATTFTLTDTPYSANSIIVTVDGILQTATTNYTVSGTTLSFGTDAPANGAAITVLHLGFSTGNKSVADGTITPTKLSSGGPKWTSAGFVGVGTASPAVNFEVSSATGSASPTPTEIRISTTTVAADWSTTLPWGRLGYYSADTSTFGPKLIATIDVIPNATSGGNASLTFNSADNSGDLLERMRITNAGAVGIGNIAPAYRLDILDVADAVAGINVRNTSAGTSARAGVLLSQDTNVAASAIWVNSSLNANFAGANSLNVYNGLNAPIGLFTGGTQRMTIDASGNVGIATASPSTFGKFAVVGNGYFSGNLGIGVSPSTNLTISSASAATGGDGLQYVHVVYTGTGTVNAGYTAKNYYGTSQIFQWENIGTRLGNRIVTNSGAGATVFTYGNDTEGFRINASAPIICLSGGSTTATGTGIAFPATQSASANANTLDDYEEGTYSPNLSFQNSISGSFTLTRNTCRYVKVGRLVHIQGWVSWSGKPSAGNTLNMTIPFSSETGDDPRGGVQIAYADACFTGLTTIYQWAFRSENGASIMIANYRNDSTTGVMNNNINAANMVTTGSFMFSGTYFASA